MHAPLVRFSLLPLGVLAALVLGIIASSASLKAQDQGVALEPWPAPGEGQTRFVIRLPKQKNEDNLKVEILVGKTLTLDAVNQYSTASNDGCASAIFLSIGCVWSGIGGIGLMFQQGTNTTHDIRVSVLAS